MGIHNYLPNVEIDYLFKEKDSHTITILNSQNDVAKFSHELKEKI